MLQIYPWVLDSVFWKKLFAFIAVFARTLRPNFCFFIIRIFFVKFAFLLYLSWVKFRYHFLKKFILIFLFFNKLLEACNFGISCTIWSAIFLEVMSNLINLPFLLRLLPFPWYLFVAVGTSAVLTLDRACSCFLIYWHKFLFHRTSIKLYFPPI